ncbi:MAG: response regulator transcription factor [Bacteroidota bacterium]
MIRVLLVDDQQMFLDGMKAFLELEKDIEIVATANNGDEALTALQQHPDIDVIVLDVEMPPGKDGIETTRIIKRTSDFRDIKVLILTMYNRKNFIVRLMEVGANGYILKNKSKEQLVQAIHRVHSGQPYFGLEILETATSANSMLEQEVQLTDREIDVLRLIAEGMTTREIAKTLGISEPTVNGHRRNLLRKLDFSNDKHLVRYAIKKGIVEL